MKKFNVISDVYKHQPINFNGFVVTFDIEGKGVIEVNDDQIEAFEKVFKMHPHIWEGDEIPAQIQIENTQKQENKQEAADSAELNFLKESNKKLAKEKLDLKKEVNELKEENASLKAKLAEFEGKKEEQEEEQKEEIQEQNQEQKEEVQEKVEEKQEEKNLKKELNTKTVAQLKEILNSEDFLPFKEEWKGLKTKDEIINYICQKVETEDK